MFLVRHHKTRQFVGYSLSSFEVPQVEHSQWEAIGEKLFYIKMRP